MSDIVRFETADGAVLVEVDEASFGVERVSRDQNGVIESARRLDQALQEARPAVRAVINTVREMLPDEYEIEFGLKLSAEAGVVVAKSAIEGHFTVRLAWRQPTERQDSAPVVD